MTSANGYILTMGITVVGHPTYVATGGGGTNPQSPCLSLNGLAAGYYTLRGYNTWETGYIYNFYWSGSGHTTGSMTLYGED